MVGVVDETGVDQGVAHERRADEAGADAVVVAAHQLGQPSRGADPLRLARQQVEAQGEGVGRLGVARHPAGRRDELVVERGGDLARQLVEAGAVGLVAEHRGGAGEQSRGVGVVGGGHQRLVGEGGTGIARRSSGIEPVAELEPLRPDVTITGERGDLLDPRPHAVVLARQHLAVAEALVEDPREHDRGVAPRRGGLRGKISCTQGT